MKVVSMVNGSLLSETASFYALAYAKSVQLPLTLLFIDNGAESLEKVKTAMTSIEEIAEANGVGIESVTLEGKIIDQLRHYVQLYAIDTLFCATRKLSNTHSFSQKIVQAKLETDIAVVKVKNISQVRSVHRILLAAGDKVNVHAYMLWLGLITSNGAMGKLYLQNPQKASVATTKSGLKYEAEPFVQIAQMLGKKIEVVNAMQPINAEDINRYLVSNNLDLAVFYAPAYPPKLLNEITDISGVNSILFYPWLTD